MATDLVKRFITKDGKYRLSIYEDVYACNPREMTDEPLHCEDWNRNFSISLGEEVNASASARSLLEYLIKNYGDRERIIDSLISNGKKIGKESVDYDSAIVYDRVRKGWLLIGTEYRCVNEIEDGWFEYDFFDDKKDDLDLCRIVEELSDDAIDYIAERFMTDSVKISSYSFGYNGEVSFHNFADCDSKGIAWIEKKEFLKYTGHNEEYWKCKTMREIEYLIEEIEHWSRGEVYRFDLDESAKYKVTKKCLTENAPDEEYEETEWHNIDGCGSYYGEINQVIDWIISETTLFNKEDLEEVK